MATSIDATEYRVELAAKDNLKPAIGTIVATFDFACVGFAALWGILLFDEIPGALTSTGIIMIVIAGVIAARQRPA